MLAEKPIPLPTEDTEPYWEACHNQQLAVCRCTPCGHHFLPPARVCPACLSDEIAFVAVSGRARVYSFIVVHRPQHPAFFDEAPYNVAIVELEEGPRMHTRLWGVDAKDVTIGMELEVVFQKVDDEITLPLFKPRNVAIDENSNVLPRKPAGKRC